VSLLGAIHITLATGGLALFAVAAGGAVIYLVEERSIKKHRTGRLFKRGAALETLDTLNRRCVIFGFALYTVAVILGAIWSRQLNNSVFTPQYSIATAAWIMFAVLLVARVTSGWRGRRAAILTLGGFVTSLTVLLIYFVRGLGGAQG
jgi:ABC-type transport system involved in cytochrome c biogenesis permease subunit